MVLNLYKLEFVVKNPTSVWFLGKTANIRGSICNLVNSFVLSTTCAYALKSSLTIFRVKKLISISNPANQKAVFSWIW